jgi:hypothetical protein
MKKIRVVGRVVEVGAVCDVTLQAGEHREERTLREPFVLQLDDGTRVRVQCGEQTRLQLGARKHRGPWQELEKLPSAALFRGAEPGPGVSCSLSIREVSLGARIAVKGEGTPQGYRGEGPPGEFLASWIGLEAGSSTPRPKRARFKIPRLHAEDGMLLGGIVSCGVAAAWLGRLLAGASATAPPGYVHGIWIGRGCVGLTAALFLASLWQVPRDGPGPVGALPRFTGQGASPSTSIDSIVWIFGLILIGTGWLLLSVVLRRTHAEGPQARVYAKGKYVGTVIEQVESYKRYNAVLVALLPLALWGARRRAARLSGLLLSRAPAGSWRTIEGTLNAPKAIVHTIAPKENGSFSRHDLVMNTEEGQIRVDTERALFASTHCAGSWERFTQRLPDRARLLVAGRFENGATRATGPESLLIFACDEGRDPRQILRTAVLRRHLLLVLAGAGVALVLVAVRGLAAADQLDTDAGFCGPRGFPPGRRWALARARPPRRFAPGAGRRRWGRRGYQAAPVGAPRGRLRR